MSKDSQPSRFGGLLSGLKDKVTSGLGPGVESFHQTFKQNYAAYNPHQSPYTLKLALLLSQHRSLSLSLTSSAENTKKFSKSFFIYSQQPPLSNGLDNIANDDLHDFKDISDRISFLLFQGALLQGDYAKKIETSRAQLKEIRNFEESLIPRRVKREEVRKEMAKIEAYKPEPNSSAAKRYSQQLAQLRAQLAALVEADEASEITMASLKRQKVQETFEQQFEAMKEYGEKLAIVAEYGKLLLQGMDVKEGGRGNDYGETGLDRTKLIRGLVQEELEGWTETTSEIKPRTLGARGLRRRETDTRSFAVTHHQELSDLENVVEEPPASPGIGSAPTELGALRPLPPALPSTARPTSVVEPSVTVYKLTDPGAVPHPTTLASSSTTSAPLPISATSKVTAPISLPEGGSLPPINLSPPALPPRSSLSIDPSPELRTLQNAEPIAAPLSPVDLITHNEPTVAETGKPIEGTGGPAKGSLAELRNDKGKAKTEIVGVAAVSGSTSDAALKKAMEAHEEKLKNRLETAIGGVEESGSGSGSGHGSGQTDAALRKAMEAQEERLRNNAEARQGSEVTPSYSEASTSEVTPVATTGTAAERKEAEARQERINRMATTNRRRLERSEGELGGGDEDGEEAPPAYEPWEENPSGPSNDTR